jgi:hypothetical protein
MEQQQQQQQQQVSSQLPRATVALHLLLPRQPYYRLPASDGASQP